MSTEELAVINGLHDRGYAVCTFSPEELRGADPSRVEEAMCIKGWDVIDVFAIEEEEQQ